MPAVSAKYGVRYDLRGMAEDEREFLSDARLGFYLCLTGKFLTLAWVFGSWTRPIAVMMVIPFGLIGAIWGHLLHGIPLTMFSVVGLIGMAGIIINDSIVLVTAIDRRLPTTDMVTAIVDGTAERLRADFLTTITTVGGLGPLLFEQSRQAAFLKPTVITLIYGLGFGIVVVLMITPHHDRHPARCGPLAEEPAAASQACRVAPQAASGGALTASCCLVHPPAV